MNTKPFASKNAALKGILVIAISLAVLAVAVGSASAGCIGVDTGTDYRCGDTVVESCIFNKNLVCPAGVHGLEVGESGITIDGYNFKITGSENAVVCQCEGEATPEEADCGIYNPGYGNVVIKNLEVENFCHGILLKGTAENKVVNNTIESCKVYDNGNESTDCFTHGILLIHTISSTVNNNKVYNNTGEVVEGCFTGGHGIKLFKFSNYNSITHNTIYGNAVAGIYAKKECEYNYAAYNELYENGKFVGGATEIGCVAHDGTVYKCGDMVVQSCTFNGDMNCPSGHGLEIGEDDIVVDGNGYCVDGVSPGDCGATMRAGIYNYGYDNVVIKNLDVKNFCFGIWLKGYYSDPTDYDYIVNSTIDNCKVHDNGNPDSGATMGIELYAASNCNVTNNEVYNNTGGGTGCGRGGMGIRMYGENHPHLYAGYHTVTNNTVYGNRLSGIYSKMKSKYNYVAYNDVYENGEGDQQFGGGIRLMCLCTNNWVIEYNNVTDNIGPGILVGGSNNIIRHNTVTGSKTATTYSWEKGHGINICRCSTNNTLTSNVFCDNEEKDIFAESCCSDITGDENTCNTTDGWNDEGTTGCTYSCHVPAEIGCVAHDGTVYKCGDMVVQSCTFNGNLVCPTDGPEYGYGLIIGEDGITIDGNGYAIDGVSPGDCGFMRAGIYNYKHDNVVIKNLEVKNFCFGIWLIGAKNPDDPVEYNTVDNCEVHDNGNPDSGMSMGIEVDKGDYCNITNNTVYNNTGEISGGCEDGGMGIRLYGFGSGTTYGHHNVINNTIYGNRMSGIYSKMSCRFNNVSYNKVYENGEVVANNCFGGGIRLECMQTNNWTVEYNNVTDNLGPGIFVRGCNNIIRYNDESGSENASGVAKGCSVGVGYGMYFSTEAGNNNVTANEFCDNAGVDIRDDGSDNSGDENTCDTTYKYDDGGTTGCSYPCAPLEIGCVAHDGTVYKCGDMVVQSCTFNGDMSCPSGHGLEIGEDGIVIDGNGYCMDGVSSGDCSACTEDNPENGDTGIVNVGYDNVVIKNVEIKNFCTGIVLKNYVTNSTIDNCTVHDNGAMGYSEEGNRTHGIHLVYHVDNCNITNNTVYNNTGAVTGGCSDGGHGIRLYKWSNNNDITNNTIYGNWLSGIFSKKKSMYNYVAYNEVYENGHAYAGTYFGGGIRLECLMTNYWTVEHNNVHDNLGPGIYVRGSNNIIRYNEESSSKNAGDIKHGCSVSAGYGMYFSHEAGNNSIIENRFCENEYKDIGDDGTGNTGDENTCDTTYSYDDEGTTGCTYPCVPLGISRDVNENEINMAGMMMLWYDIADYLELKS